jgi:hypothetical protein
MYETKKKENTEIPSGIYKEGVFEKLRYLFVWERNT